ncbi:MAG: primosomal protein N' [Desulfobacteraceae bacterium 4572_130]|nr:MAG: primosomal protein N' [Desulfobacteraceae bacterium 4572_130]
MDKKNKYIEVAIALPVYNTYLYKIPLSLNSLAKPGMRVLVPFGKRRVTGYIIARQKQNNGYHIKNIIDILDNAPLFPESMIPFLKWLGDYYIYPLGEVIKTALPVGLNRYDVLFVSLTEKGIKQEKSGTLTLKESKIINILKVKPNCSLKSLGDKLKNSRINTFIKQMEQKGLITVKTLLKQDQAKIKKEKFILKGWGYEKQKLSKKRAAILSIIEKRKEISLKILRKEIPTAPRLVKILSESGFVKIVEREVFRDPFGDPVEPDIPPQLNKEQAEIVSYVKQRMDKGFQRYLLSGVTSSGKTEVYMRLVAKALAMSKQAIVLVPEISLISQTERRFRARFGEKVAVLHSGLSKSELFHQWKRIIKKHATVVIGARSSIFAPMENLGIIIVDEEHDTSYKQDSSLRYNARDIAIVRAKFDSIPVILGSATPSVQSYYNACKKKFHELKLEKRVNKHPLPEITLIDLKKYKNFRGRERLITPELSKEIRKVLDNGEQVLIFLNRRGFATFSVCQDCGKTVKCKFCDISMTLHKDYNEFRCHLCGFSLSPRIKCMKCGSLKINLLGFGTEKIQEMLQILFPDARIARLDQDTASKKGATVRILKKIKNRTVDIIVGTQMLAKGHDFPSITLVGIICADLSLNFPDFRAGERTFQLLAQVAGRAGRGEKKGKVILQTYNPEHFSIKASKHQDFREFYHKEIPFRQGLCYPPFSRIIQLKISGTDKNKVKKYSLMAGEICKNLLRKNKQNEIQMLGPIEAGIPKIALRYRWQILLKSSMGGIINKFVKELICNKKILNQKHIRISIDVDPYLMM